MYDRIVAGNLRQRRIHELSAAVAPVLAVRSLSMAMAGTDFSQHAHFAKAAEEYRRLFNREMNMDMVYNQKDPTATYMRGQPQRLDLQICSHDLQLLRQGK